MVATQSVGDLPVGSVQMEIPGQLIRRRLEKLIEQLRKGDILVVTRLDRLARSTSELLRIAERLTEKSADCNLLLGPIASGAGDLFFEQLFASGGGEALALAVEGLISGRHPGVSEPSCERPASFAKPIAKVPTSA